MEADWSIEAGDDAPVIAVPWFVPPSVREAAEENVAAAAGFVDLRRDPHAIERIGEARAWPEMRAALLQLNASDSPVWTAKCDVWPLSEEERQLDFGPVPFGFGAYCDVFPSERSVFRSLPAMQSTIEDWTARARQLPPQQARAEFVLRPACWDLDDGYAATVYVFAYGRREAAARRRFEHAVAAIAVIVASADCTIEDVPRTAVPRPTKP